MYEKKGQGAMKDEEYDGFYSTLKTYWWLLVFLDLNFNFNLNLII